MTEKTYTYGELWRMNAAMNSIRHRLLEAMAEGSISANTWLKLLTQMATPIGITIAWDVSQSTIEFMQQQDGLKNQPLQRRVTDHYNGQKRRNSDYD